MSLFMETTQVADTTTVAAIQHLLATRGASSVMVQYNQGRVEAVSFLLRIDANEVPFRLPCRWQSVEKLLRTSTKRKRRKDSYEEWARRVAWRQILRWVEAQLALVETGMVKTQEVFLPYACVGEKTMYQVIEEKHFLALPKPKDDDDDGIEKK